MSEYALSVLVPLPAGVESYELLRRQTAEERASSLTALDSMVNLLASLEADQEDSLRSLLSETSDGTESPVEVTIGESNYLILASIIDHQIAEASQPDAAEGDDADADSVPGAPAIAVGEDAAESLMCDGISTKETMGHVRVGLRQIEKILALVESIESKSLTLEGVEPVELAAVTGYSTPPARESLETIVRLASKVLGREESDLSAVPGDELGALAESLSVEALTAVEAETPAAEADTDPSTVTVENPLLGEEVGEILDVKSDAPKATDLSRLTKTTGTLLGSSALRRSLRGR